jgi:hypothetical protein
MDAFRVLDHDAMVGREVRLALGAVEDDRFDGEVARRRQLHVRRERGAAESDDASLLDGADDLVGRERFPARYQTRTRYLRREGLDGNAYGGIHAAVGMRP